MTSKRHPPDRRSRRRLWGVFWALQAILLALAAASLGGEAGVLLTVMGVGVTGSLLTAHQREPLRAEKRREPLRPEKR